jgi:hypothetical protein
VTRRAKSEPDQLDGHSESDDRLERLIAAQEAQTNAINRLVQTLEGKHKRTEQSRRTRMRRAVVDKPITVTPIVEAAVKRALARVSR